MKLKDIIVKGQTFEVDINQRGEFGANFPDDGGHRTFPSLKELEQALIKHLAKATLKVAVPFARWMGSDGLKKGVATGLHARNNNVLVKYDDGSTEQLDPWRTDTLRFPSPEAEQEFVQISHQAYELEAKRRELWDKYKFRVRDEVNKALEEKLKAQDAKGA